MVNVIDVARRAGVSPATVSRALTGGAAVAKGTRARVLSAVQELGYRPNVVAQSLKRGRSRTVALVTGDIEQGVYAALAKALQNSLGEQDLDLMLFDMAHSEERLSQLIARSSSLGLRGLLLAAPHFISNQDLLRIRTSPGAMQILSISQPLDAHGVISIVSDDKAGAEMAVRHLLERGRGRIAFLGRIQNSAVGKLRFDGYRKALADAGIAFDRNLIWDTSRSYRFEAGYEAVASALNKGTRFRAVLGASDELALGGMAAVHDRGMHTPGDIAFVGFGGLRWGAYTRPSLTTVALDIAKLATAVGETFREILGERERPLLTLIPPHLVERGSS